MILQDIWADVDDEEPIFEIVVWAVFEWVAWVDGHFLGDIVGAGCEVDADALAGAAFADNWVVGLRVFGEGAAALEVFVDYVLRGEVHDFLIGPIGIYVCKDMARRCGARADCARIGDLTLF